MEKGGGAVGIEVAGAVGADAGKAVGAEVGFTVGESAVIDDNTNRSNRSDLEIGFNPCVFQKLLCSNPTEFSRSIAFHKLKH